MIIQPINCDIFKYQSRDSQEQTYLWQRQRMSGVRLKYCILTVIKIDMNLSREKTYFYSCELNSTP